VEKSSNFGCKNNVYYESTRAIQPHIAIQGSIRENIEIYKSSYHSQTASIIFTLYTLFCMSMRALCCTLIALKIALEYNFAQVQFSDTLLFRKRLSKTE
jgi:hypothetical protein